MDAFTRPVEPTVYQIDIRGTLKPGPPQVKVYTPQPSPYHTQFQTADDLLE